MENNEAPPMLVVRDVVGEEDGEFVARVAIEYGNSERMELDAYDAIQFGQGLIGAGFQALNETFMCQHMNNMGSSRENTGLMLNILRQFIDAKRNTKPGEG